MSENFQKCEHENCDDTAEWESFFPDGWLRECNVHAIEYFLNNWVADCYQQRMLEVNE